MNKKQRCVTAKVGGYSWNDSASDHVTVGLRGMAKQTTFVWYVHGRKVATKTARYDTSLGAPPVRVGHEAQRA